jgi:hypothetical protein
MRIEMDYLVVDDCSFDKKAQPVFRKDKDRRTEYELD